MARLTDEEVRIRRDLYSKGTLFYRLCDDLLAAREVLRAIEYTGSDEYCCPICQVLNGKPHEEDCALADAMGLEK